MKLSSNKYLENNYLGEREMKIIISIIGLLIISASALSQDLSDLTVRYSDLTMKCSTVDKSISVYLNKHGDLYRNEYNSMSWAIYTSKYDQWYAANKKQSASKDLFNSSRSYVYEYVDPFAYEYKINFEKLSYFVDGKKSEATLTRSHKHPEINHQQEFKLNCVTSVSVTSISMTSVTAKVLSTLSEDHQAYIIAKIAYTEDDHFDAMELTSQQQDLYTYYSRTGFSENVWDLKEVKYLTKIQMKLLKRIYVKETKDASSCISDVLDMYDMSQEEREEVLGNWNVCSFELYVVRDSLNKLVGFVIDRYNDNGVDDTDGHNGSISVLNSKGSELMFKEWYP
jgi:hypothetical protein